MRKAVAAVAKGLGLASRLPANWTQAPRSPDAELASALEALANIEAAGRQKQQHDPQPSSDGPKSPLQATADELASRTTASPATSKPGARMTAETAALLAKANGQLSQELDGKTLGELGRLLHSGESGVPKDVNRATELWKLGAGKGDVYSMHQVALALVDGEGTIPKHRGMAEKALMELMNKGRSGLAAFALASMLLRTQLEEAGVGGAGGSGASVSDLSKIPKDSRMHVDTVRAFQALDMAARADVPYAWLNLAQCYLHGVGTATDARQGIKWLRKGADNGDVLAVVELASRLGMEASSPALLTSKPSSSGTPAKADPLDELRRAQARWESLRLWRRAAEAGHPLAMHNIGAALMEGWGPWLAAPQPHMKNGSPVVPAKGGPDVAAAVIWFRRAAGLGFQRSLLNAAAILEKGAEGVPADAAQAMELYKRSQSLSRRAMEAARSPTGAAPAKRLHDLVTAQMLRLKARMASGTAAAPSDESSLSREAELRLDFATVEERDAALDALQAQGPGQGGILTTGGLLQYLSSAKKTAGTGTGQQEQGVKVTVLNGKDKEKDMA